MVIGLLHVAAKITLAPDMPLEFRNQISGWHRNFLAWSFLYWTSIGVGITGAVVGLFASAKFTRPASVIAGIALILTSMLQTPAMYARASRVNGIVDNAELTWARIHALDSLEIALDSAQKVWQDNLNPPAANPFPAPAPSQPAPKAAGNGGQSSPAPAIPPKQP